MKKIMTNGVLRRPANWSLKMRIFAMLIAISFFEVHASTYSFNTETVLETKDDAIKPVQQSISGSVTDSNGAPLPGVNILVQGTNKGTQTDFDGNFSIDNVASDAILTFSYVGFATQNVPVNGQSTINVVLAEDAAQLDEVVVVGYGSTTKKEITSSVTQVGEEEFNKGTINNPSELLQGKVAGLSIYNKGGNPNDDAVIRLRGISTVGSNSSPLIVIDGVIGASLNNIDPSDIASMTVLKDGSAAAIYGSRGSSGVIIVTTKAGKSGSTQVSYNGSVAVASINNSIDTLTGDEFAAAGGTDLGSRTDWTDLVTRDAVSNIHNVSIAGGYDQTKFRVSTNFRDAQGILNKSGFNQFNTRLNAGTTILDDKLKVDFNASYTKRDSDFGFNEALRYAVLYNPTAPVYGVGSPYPFNAEPYGGYFETLGLFDSFNPVSIINQNINKGSRNEFTYSAKFKYSLSDNLALNALYSEQSKKYTNSEYYRTTSLFRGNATSPTRKGLARLTSGEDRFKLFEIYGDYDVQASDKLDMKFTGGYSWQEESYNNYFLSAGDFPNDDLEYLDALEWSQDQINAGQIDISSDRSPEQRIIAYFGRVSGTFDDAIYFNASVRREGSTKLGENNKWGTFPAFGLGVDLNKYLQLDNTDLFKVRLGYGVTGSLPGQYGLAYARYSPAADLLSTNQDTDANPDLKWEEKAETNLGIEYSAGRFNATLDLYTRKVSDFILERAVDVAVYPTGSRVENGGDLSTKGFELAVNFDIVKKENLTYNSGLVLSSYKTTLDSFDSTTLRGNLGAPGQNDTAVILVAPGEEIGQIYGAVWTGEVVNGSQVFADVNGDGNTDASQTSQIIGNLIDADEDGVIDGDLAKLGKGIPDFELGWSHTLTFKNWDVNAFFRGAFGHSLVNNFRVFYEPRVGSQGSYNFVNTELAEPTITNAKFSSLYVEKADFVKLDNFSVGYTFDISEDNKYFKDVRLSLSGQNLFTITNYTGADPEPSLQDRGSVDNGGFLGGTADPLTPGIDRRYNYFASRTITFGINVNF
ncbi:iron complex outermembrane receptor protein [Lutibacter oceani]|uniref:Iron complex outermembrane receptor protein n=1 Tax=Lutibacter oceani TaxID=1853311 RepID=A0A3D9S0G6_9FLAO|nr:SusC/RagA family TonB-linked outer membrane protein [Lutibacter oceani]REE83324.1 iron complex outermembrane receptor protein [Lutibacter oceani]